MKKGFASVVGLFAAVAVVSAVSPADAACLEALTYGEAQGRNAWASMWGYITPSEEMQLNSVHQYVEFSNGCYRLTMGGVCNPVVPVTAGGAFNPSFIKSSFCAADCYTPSQRILVGGEYKGIEDAAMSASGTVTTLAAGSTAAELKLLEQPVASFSSAPISEEIYVLEGDAQERLEVTGGHPMVLGEGTLVPARSLKEGDTLAAADGGLIRLVRIGTYSYEGMVWNVDPESKEKAENIIVAEGFLAGSMKFQAQWAYDKFRLSVRDHVDVDKIKNGK